MGYVFDEESFALFTLLLDSIKYSLEGTIRKATFFAGLLVTFISRAEPLGAKVECIAERFVDAGKNVGSCHEDTFKSGATRSWVRRDKDWFVGHDECMSRCKPSVVDKCDGVLVTILYSKKSREVPVRNWPSFRTQL